MDRFIESYLFFIVCYSSNLKSNMDRFIEPVGVAYISGTFI